MIWSSPVSCHLFVSLPFCFDVWHFLSVRLLISVWSFLFASCFTLNLKGNVVHHFSEDVFDNGGLYWAPDDWTDWNYTITKNVFFLGAHKAIGCNEDTSCTRAAIYCDDGAVGGVIDSNTIWTPKPQYPTSTENPRFIDVNQWAVMINGGRNWAVTNNINIDSAAFYETGAGVTWNTAMQSSDSDYYSQMKAEKWDTGVYARKYPKLAKLSSKWPGKRPCQEALDCPAAPWDVHVINHAAFNATPTPAIEAKAVVLCADADSAGNNDPSCSDFPNENTEMKGNYIDQGALGFAAMDPRTNVDFTLAASSPVLKTGFKPIMYNTIGPLYGGVGCCAEGCMNC